MIAGSLCTGYGGLELGATLAFGPLRMAWHSEIDPAMSAVLARRWPGIPNLGDMTKIDFAGLPAIDLLLAGYPCQPFSNAGRQQGFDDPRNRWPDVARAIAALRPRAVLLENVAAHLNRGFDQVTADLSALGYTHRHAIVAASSAGAPHQRRRLFVIAWPAPLAPPNPARLADAPAARRYGGALLPTPRANSGTGAGIRGEGGLNLQTVAAALFPTPIAGDGARGSKKNMRGNPTLLGALLPTPTVTNAGGGNRHNGQGDLLLPGAADEMAAGWGRYTDAVHRWQQTTGRSAPGPTVTGPKGGQQLNPRFVEWMMGLPAGWVTDIIDKRTPALRGLGNGVVPQAVPVALAQLLGDVIQAPQQLQLIDFVHGGQSTQPAPETIKGAA